MPGHGASAPRRHRPPGRTAAGLAGSAVAGLAALAVACAPEGPTAVEETGSAEGAPGVVRDLSVADRGASFVELRWAPPEEGADRVAEYRVYRDGDEVAAPTSTSFRDTGLEPATEYAYRVTAIDGSGAEGEPSPRLAAETTEPSDEADETPPSVPGDVEAEAESPSEVELSWSASADGESDVDFYRVQRDGEEVATPSETSFRDSGLEPATEYAYRVSAVNGAGLESDPSSEASAETPDDPPSAPRDLRAEEVKAREVELAWSAAEDPQTGIDAYRVYRDGEEVGTSSGTSFRDADLEPVTEYAYRVSAVNGSGLEGETTSEVEVTTRDETPPSVPEDLRATDVDAHEVELEWSASEDPETGVDLYRVFRDGEEIGTASETEFEDDDVSPFTVYRYRVSAVNGDGLESDRSDEVTVLTDAFDDDEDDEDDDHDE